MKFDVISNESVNGIPFGCSRDVIKQNFKIVKTFEVESLNILTDSTNDSCYFTYNDNKEFEYIVIYPTKDTTITFDGEEVPTDLEKFYDFLLLKDLDTKVHLDCVWSSKLGISANGNPDKKGKNIHHYMFFSSNKRDY